ncbi:hypothetical protein CMI37_36570 [Candidatus Pacearchaeota archaeon]|nr:hypothetical protein [Candidatus Pacearchaeota archaeon]
MKLVVEVPLNSLSFGNVSVNLLREMYKREYDIALFPIGEKAELEAYDKLDKDFLEWIQASANTRFDKLDKDRPSLKLWHINGAEKRYTPRQYLFTFYELDTPTNTEKNIVKLQNKTIFSSAYARKSFKLYGCDNAENVPLGFDQDFHKLDKEYLEGKVHFGLMGKFEKRKHTSKIIKLWALKYGNNYKYQLTCCISNPFLKGDHLNQLISESLEGKRYGNINFVPYLKTNSEVNDFLNSIQIDLSGMSGAEGWNLPAFNASALGKWSIVLNASSHKDWANEENSILIQPNGKEPAADGVFFSPDGPFNQGNIYTFDPDELVASMEKAEETCQQENKEGLKLQESFTYSNTLDKIIDVIKTDTANGTVAETT